MTLNGVIALILRYFTEFDSFAGRLAYLTVVEDRPLLAAEYHLPLLAKTDPPYTVRSLRDSWATCLIYFVDVFSVIVSEHKTMNSKSYLCLFFTNFYVLIIILTKDHVFVKVNLYSEITKAPVFFLVHDVWVVNCKLDACCRWSVRGWREWLCW